MRFIDFIKAIYFSLQLIATNVVKREGEKKEALVQSQLNFIIYKKSYINGSKDLV